MAILAEQALNTYEPVKIGQENTSDFLTAAFRELLKEGHLEEAKLFIGSDKLSEGQKDAFNTFLFRHCLDNSEITGAKEIIDVADTKQLMRLVQSYSNNTNKDDKIYSTLREKINALPPLIDNAQELLVEVLKISLQQEKTDDVKEFLGKIDNNSLKNFLTTELYVSEESKEALKEHIESKGDHVQLLKFSFAVSDGTLSKKIIERCDKSLLPDMYKEYIEFANQHDFTQNGDKLSPIFASRFDDQKEFNKFYNAVKDTNGKYNQMILKRLVDNVPDEFVRNFDSSRLDKSDPIVQRKAEIKIQNEVRDIIDYNWYDVILRPLYELCGLEYKKDADLLAKALLMEAKQKFQNSESNDISNCETKFLKQCSEKQSELQKFYKNIDNHKVANKEQSNFDIIDNESNLKNPEKNYQSMLENIKNALGEEVKFTFEVVTSSKLGEDTLSKTSTTHTHSTTHTKSIEINKSQGINR